MMHTCFKVKMKVKYKNRNLFNRQLLLLTAFENIQSDNAEDF